MAAPIKTRRLKLSSDLTTQARSIHSHSGPLLFQATPALWGMPMKKKKRMDPGVLNTREAKRKKKLERQIKRLEKFARKMKPVDEIAGDTKLRKELNSRKRERTVLTFDESERRALLQKDWTRFKQKQHCDEMKAFSGLVLSQQRALEELRNESEELYQMAIQTDDQLIPYECKGPVRTPPIENYECPDGEYIDTTRKY